MEDQTVNTLIEQSCLLERLPVQGKLCCRKNYLTMLVEGRPEPIMLLKLPIMLLGNAPKIFLLCSNYAQSCAIMP